MATRSKQTTAIANYDEEFAKQAKAARASEPGATGSFFSMRGGRLSFNDAPVPNNQLAVIILDHVIEQVWYDKPFDSDRPSSPPCYAFSRDPKTLVPHEAAPIPQAEACGTCPKNVWGSKIRSDGTPSRGKACSERRRLAVINAGQLDANGNFVAIEDVDHYATTQVAYLNLPVTSTKGFGAYVHQLDDTMRRPPHGVFTRVYLEPDKTDQFHVVFEALGKIPAAISKTILDRHAKQAEQTIFPYPVFDDVEPAPARGRGRSAKPAAAKPRRKAF